MKSYAGNKLWLATVLLLTSGTHLWAGTLFCPKDSIVGWENEVSEAKVYVGKDTTPDAAHMNVYVKSRDGSLYIQSNYQPDGQEHPFKIVSDDKIHSIDSALGFLVNPKDTQSGMESVEPGLRTGITLFVEQTVFKDPKYGSLSFGEAKNVKIICPDGKIRSSTAVVKDDFSSERIVQLDDKFSHLFTRATQPEAIEHLSQVANQLFQGSECRLLSLVSDTATNKEIAKRIPHNQVTFDVTRGDASALKQILAANRGKTLFVLGHVENGAFVDKSGGKEFKMAIPALEEIAKENDITLIAMGCNTAASSSVSSIGKAVIHTMDVIPLLQDALQSKTRGEFLQHLSSSKLLLVVDDSVIQGKRSQIKIVAYKTEVDVFGASIVTPVAILVIVSDVDNRSKLILPLAITALAGGAGLLIRRKRASGKG